MGEVWLLLRFTKMKLSSSLLVVAGVYADYACCPYNDYGVVDTNCEFTERTAWGDSGGSEQHGLTQHACKAWEANTDATKDGSLLGYNWGGCGFQRLFPWANSGTPGGVGNYDSTAQKLIVGKHNGGANVLADSSGTAFTPAPFGKVALNGVCKLFVPVKHADIGYVSIAGVHVHGNGYEFTAGGTDCGGNNFCSVFDAKFQNAAGQQSSQSGTAYCFAVSNPAEGLSNTNGVNNGNIAGPGPNNVQPAHTGAANSITGPVEADFTPLAEKWGNLVTFPTPADAAVPNGEDNAEGGPNFDVVVHFKSTWCQTHWTLIDMQDTHTVGTDTFVEHGDGTLDYPLNHQNAADWPGTASNFNHAHHDAMDKRFAGDICGPNPPLTNQLGGVTNDCAGGAANTYASPGGHKWPNAGAWAGFYSHIVCQNNDNSAVAAKIYAKTGTVVRTVLLSNFNNDWRRADDAGDTVKIRGNVRQVGDQVQYCAPGELPASGAHRCTWNWNFANAHLSDDTAFDSPKYVADLATPFTVNFDAGGWGGVSTSDATITVGLAHGNFQQDDIGSDTAVLAESYTPELSTSNVVWKCDDNNCAASGNAFTGTLVLSCDNAGGSDVDAKKDFPLCFTGEEVHFEARVPVASIDTAKGTYEDITYISAWYSTVTLS